MVFLCLHSESFPPLEEHGLLALPRSIHDGEEQERTLCPIVVSKSVREAICETFGPPRSMDIREGVQKERVAKK